MSPLLGRNGRALLRHLSIGSRVCEKRTSRAVCEAAFKAVEDANVAKT